mgnify:CR=1 FL=1
MAAEQVNTWLDAYPASRFHAIAKKRLAVLPRRRPRHVLTSVGRLVRQKASLMLEPLHDGRPALAVADTVLGDAADLTRLDR